MESSRPIYLILCATYVLLIGGNWSISVPNIKLPCLYGVPHKNLLDNQTVSPKPAWIILGSRHVIHEQGIKFIFKDSPVNPLPFLKEGLNDVKCDITPYFTANTQILWPGVNTENVLDTWYTYTVRQDAGKFHAVTIFAKLSEMAQKKEEDTHHALATLMVITKTPNIYVKLMGSALLDCAFTVDHRADVSVTWSYRGGGSPEVKILSYNGITKKLHNNWKDAHMWIEQLRNGNASLLVTNLSLKSEGLFTCAISVASLLIEEEIHLKVRESPSVSLNVASVVTLREGDEQKFLCDATSYYPLDVNIQWLREKKNTGFLPSLMSNIIYSSHRKNHNGTYSLSGFFLYTASPQDNGITFTCRVEHESLQKPIRKSVTVIVEESLTWNFVIFFIFSLNLVLLFCLIMFFKGNYFMTLQKQNDIISKSYINSYWSC
ncbi:hypothetical protein GDO81_006723 [Engystomops pustulosus]|uniref:Ig-like domain-containing protein n=1 Tax=Engystomops pustulosus TaxID=76066 RepID=A0AAV7CYW5_ENGPU|nr:hypothetical protein GDO81_006723 [Engystomops pustulosus]